MQKNKVIIHIKPEGGFGLDLKELWDYRELFLIFAWRDIKVRYKQTFLGIAWAVFQPLITMVIFSFFFGKLAGIPSGELPYAVFVLIGLTVWTFFSNYLSHASTSLIDQGQMIKKVYFPRVIIPVTPLITGCVDLGITSIFLSLVLVYYRLTPQPLLFFLLPILILIVGLSSSGLGFFLSALNVKYRDVRYILPFFIQIMMFFSPVIYPSSIIADRHKWVLILNPLTGVVEALRTLIGGSSSVDWTGLMLSGAFSLSIFIAGLKYFKKSEKLFADIS